MGIMISKLRIKNFRSIKELEMSLSMTSVLIGANNAGKSNILKALNLAVGQNRMVSIEDIFVEKDEVLNNTKQAIIDIMIRPIDETNKITTEFSQFWIGTFTDKWISTEDPTGNYVGIRSIIQYDSIKNDYTIIRKNIRVWGENIGLAKTSPQMYFTADMNTYLSVYYMDAQRDIVDDIRDRKSFFGRATSKVDLSPEKLVDIEKQLSDVNSLIVESIPALNQTAERIATIASTIGEYQGAVEIEPLVRKISDLHKGMDITFRDGDAAKIPVSQHGMGTRSWISFLTLGAYVDWEKQRLMEEDSESDSFVCLTMEEPEAHLHPQAQQKLYRQLCGFSGQKVISTHSPSVVAQAELTELRYVIKKNGTTDVYGLSTASLSNEEVRRIKREVTLSHGELLFAKAIVLCEGITEEQALPVFFREKFDIEPSYCGICIIGIGGQNYKTFLSLIKDFNIPWYIFSDGEKSTIKTVKKAVDEVFSLDAEQCDNVVILDNQEDFEKHLLACGYEQEIIAAIGEIEENSDFIRCFIMKHNHELGKSYKTEEVCPKCNQYIYKKDYKDYSGDEGFKKAIYDCWTSGNGKAKYALSVAEKIVSSPNIERRIPKKIDNLFEKMKTYIMSEGDGKNVVIRETTSDS